MIEVVRISEAGKSKLSAIKRRTGVENWNIICRWAFLLSLSDSSKVPYENIIANSNVEMTWKTFAGTYEKLYLALLLSELKKQKIEINKKNVNEYFKIYLHRGISLLMNPKFKDLNNYCNHFTKSY
jgi:DNA sulfur modification protein DndE